jgi:predicted sulfurtransferase
MRTELRSAFLLLGLLAILPAAAHGQGIDAPRISQADFKKLIAAKNVIVVDTRVVDVFSLGHIPGALLLPLEGAMTWPEEYEKTVAKLVASKKPVVTYCA